MLECILIKQPFEVSFSKNPIPFVFALAPYNSADRNADIRLQVAIEVEQNPFSGVFEEVKTQQFYPDSDGMIHMNASPVLDPFLQYFMPSLQSNQLLEARGQRKRFRLRYQLIRDNAVAQAAQTTNSYQVMKGGLSQESWHPSEFFTQVVAVEKRGLLQTKQSYHKDEPIFLFFTYPVADLLLLSIDVTLKTLNAAPVTVHPINNVRLSQWGIGCLAIGYDALNLGFSVGPADTLISYSVSIKGFAGATIIGPIEIVLEQRNFYDRRTLLYRNSLGGLQTLSMRGQLEFSADYDRQEAKLMSAPNYFENLHVKKQISHSTTEQYKTSGDTGFLSRSDADLLRDLLLSEEVYEVKGDNFVPVVLSVKSAKFFSNRDGFTSLQIDWLPAFTNDRYTPADLMPTARACPLPESFSIRQKSRTQALVLWSLPMPYALIEVELYDQLTGNTYVKTRLKGNSGSRELVFNNPAGPGSTVTISVKYRVVCDPYSYPESLGIQQNTIFQASGNSDPVAVDDHYTIGSGYNSAVTLPFSVLANDSDPDGDPIEVIVASGATHAGGAFSINAAGIVQYTPPTSAYSGVDWFDYQMQEVGGGTPATARAFITVGSAVQGVFAKIVYRNTYGNAEFSSGEVWVDFFSNPAGTTPLDITTYGLTINYNKRERLNSHFTGSSISNTPQNIAGTGTKVMIHSGGLWSYTYDPSWSAPDEQELTFQILAGSGYTGI